MLHYDAMLRRQFFALAASLHGVCPPLMCEHRFDTGTIAAIHSNAHKCWPNFAHSIWPKTCGCAAPGRPEPRSALWNALRGHCSARIYRIHTLNARIRPSTEKGMNKWSSNKFHLFMAMARSRMAACNRAENLMTLRVRQFPLGTVN